jgi:hypothetical protein
MLQCFAIATPARRYSFDVPALTFAAWDMRNNHQLNLRLAMKRIILLVTILAGASPLRAGASPIDFTFSAPGLSASGTLDVVGNQASSGTGTINGTSLSGTETITLVTLSTPLVHDLGGGGVSYRFGGGTDLIGDTFLDPNAIPPLDANGLVFIVGGPGHNGFNVWANSATSFTGFLAGDAIVPGGPIVFEGHNGTFGLAAAIDVPEPLSAGLLGVGLIGLGLVRRR